jgi:hypothetical protein
MLSATVGWSIDDQLAEFRAFLRSIQCERIAAGRYVVVLNKVVDGKSFVARIPCSNPAYGFKRRSEMEARLRRDGRVGDEKSWTS